jgi:hypothetical protein
MLPQMKMLSKVLLVVIMASANAHRPSALIQLYDTTKLDKKQVNWCDKPDD